MRALNHTLQTRSDFDYLLFCDQDDVWRYDKLATLDAVIRSKGAPDLLHSDARLVDEVGAVLAESLFSAPACALGSHCTRARQR